MRRSARRVAEAGLVAAVLSGAPSTVHALLTTRSVRGAAAYVVDATTAIGELLPPFQPDLFRGAVAHLVVSAGVAGLLGATLPRSRSVVWGGAAGLAIGLVNVGVVGRRFPHVRELPIGPQLADNLAFGVVFAAIADRKENA